MARKIFACVISLVFFLVSFASFVGYANAADNKIISETMIHEYSYPITCDSDEWNNYTVREKVEMLRIPDDILTRMTDEALVNAIADYPYLVDIYLYGDSIADGIEISRRYFCALDEFLSRQSGNEILSQFALTTANDRFASYNLDTETQDGHDLFVGNAILDIFNYIDEDVVAVYTGEESSFNSYIALSSATTVPYRQVELINKPEYHTVEQHEAADQEVLSTYAVTRVSRGTCKYNCHSYAWYSQSTSNMFWINDPTPYMESGEYTRTYNGLVGTPSSSTSVRSGDIIFYGQVDEDPSGWHSAIYLTQTNSGIPLASQRCISKWGQLGVFEHSLANVPADYDTSWISAWREV